LAVDEGYVSYRWSPGGETVNRATAGGTGLYVVKLIDENDCESSASIWVDYWPAPNVVVVADPAEVACEGSVITLSVPGEFSAWQWSPGGETTATIDVTQTGHHGVTVIDAHGCPGQGGIDVTFRPLGGLADLNHDCRVNLFDYQIWHDCRTAPGQNHAGECQTSDLEGDGDVDLADFAIFAELFGS
jgi:hypothetical protein